MRIGFPRALLMYQYYPMWRTFLEELDVQVVMSPFTNKTLLDEGTKTAVDDSCLPVKVFHGHVKYLIDKTDMIFIPRIMSIAKGEFICPKFCGLPEMIRNSIKIPFQMAVLNVNLHRNENSLYDNYAQFGAIFSKDRKKIKNAFFTAMYVQSQYEQRMLTGERPFSVEKKNAKKGPIGKATATIGLLGHPYVIYDDFLNMHIVDKLISQGVAVLTPEMVPTEKIEEESAVFPKKMFWTLGKHIYGSGKYMLENQCLDGIIYLSSFACGIDSIMVALVERYVHKKRIPFTMISLDEHTGEAGINTRLEAFLDMIFWRNQHEGHFSPYGKCVYSH